MASKGKLPMSPSVSGRSDPGPLRPTLLSLYDSIDDFRYVLQWVRTVPNLRSHAEAVVSEFDEYCHGRPLLNDGSATSNVSQDLPEDVPRPLNFAGSGPPPAAPAPAPTRAMVLSLLRSKDYVNTLYNAAQLQHNGYLSFQPDLAQMGKSTLFNKIPANDRRPPPACPSVRDTFVSLQQLLLTVPSLISLIDAAIHELEEAPHATPASRNDQKALSNDHARVASSSSSDRAFEELQATFEWKLPKPPAPETVQVAEEASGGNGSGEKGPEDVEYDADDEGDGPTRASSAAPVSTGPVSPGPSSLEPVQAHHQAPAASNTRSLKPLFLVDNKGKGRAQNWDRRLPPGISLRRGPTKNKENQAPQPLSATQEPQTQESPVPPAATRSGKDTEYVYKTLLEHTNHHLLARSEHQDTQQRQMLVDSLRAQTMHSRLLADQHLSVERVQATLGRAESEYAYLRAEHEHIRAVLEHLTAEHEHFRSEFVATREEVSSTRNGTVALRTGMTATRTDMAAIRTDMSIIRFDMAQLATIAATIDANVAAMAHTGTDDVRTHGTSTRRRLWRRMLRRNNNGQ